MPISKKNTRRSGIKSAVLKGSVPVKPGFEAEQLKQPKGSGKSQQTYGGKPPRFPGRAGGR